MNDTATATAPARLPSDGPFANYEYRSNLVESLDLGFYGHADNWPDGLAGVIRDEAYRENESRPTGQIIGVDSFDDPGIDPVQVEVNTVKGYRDNDERLAHLRRIIVERNDLTARVESLTARVNSLANDQITDGGDPRLIEFWENAAEKAESEGYCSEYDRMADLLGGIPRRREYSHRVAVTFSIWVTSSGRDEDDAAEDIDGETVMEQIIEKARYDQNSIDWEVEHSELNR